jgi:hypothetical protein
MLDEIKIKIKGQEFIVKKSFRSLLLFEELSGKGIDQLKETLTDLMLLFYCILKANNKDTFNYTLDEFISAIDEAEEKPLDKFNEYLVGQAKGQVDDKKKVAKKQ